MADSLDDFFAKKDKKKGKGKAVLSAEALVKELEEGSKKTEYPVRKEAKTSTAIELLGLDADDADWRDFEDIEKRDYTGLKVKEMSLQDQTEDDQRRLSADQTETLPDATAWRIKDDSAPPTEEPAPVETTPQQKASSTSDADSSANKTAAGVASSSSSDPSTNENPEAKKSETDSENPEKKGDKPSAKVYVPPHERNAEGGRSGSGEVRVLEPVKLSKMKTTSSRFEKIPDIQDEKLFPSLG